MMVRYGERGEKMPMEIQYNIVIWEAETATPTIENFPQSWQQRLTHHKLPEKRREAIFAYDLLYHMVEAQLGYAPEIEGDQQGKPCFLEEPFHFSISHTKGAAMVALGMGSVGCDIEKIRPVSPHMMERVADTENETAFFQTWVQREAIGKCIGTGITAVGQVMGDTTEIAVKLVAAPSGYTAAVAKHA